MNPFDVSKVTFIVPESKDGSPERQNVLVT